MTMTPKAGGDSMTAEGRFTAVAKKVGGRWLYVADHEEKPAP